MNFIKKNLKKILGLTAVAAILVFAFWYGGNAPGSRGFSVKQNTSETSDTGSDEAEAVDGGYYDEQYVDKDGNPVRKKKSSDEADDATENFAGTGTGEAVEVGGGSNGNGNGSGSGDIGDGSDKGKGSDDGSDSGNGSGNGSGDGSGNGPGKGDNTADPGKKDEPTTEAPTTETPTGEPTEDEIIGYCSISISCKNILNNMDLVDENKKAYVPTDGVILKKTEVPIRHGDTVFDVLRRITKEKGIQMEYSYTPMYGSMYIEGIGNLYEFDCGNLSGWMYSVNGVFPGFGCSKYVLNGGEVIRWLYTCDLGGDVGNPY